MRLELAPITDVSSLAHVSPEQLVFLMEHRAPRLAARAQLPAKPTLEQLSDIIRDPRPEDECDDFLSDLHLIARVCRHESAEDLALDKNISLSDVTLGDALARAAVKNREAFEAVADHATVLAASKGSTFTLFSPRESRTGLELTADQTARLRKECIPFFGELGQGSHCDVRFYAENDHCGFLIDHAGARRTERRINEREKPEVRQFRPFRHDIVLLQRGTGQLRILARSERERIFYADLISETLVGKPGLFSPAETYVLDAISDPDYGVVLAGLQDAEIERVALRELKLACEDDFSTRQVLASNDVLGSINSSGMPLGNVIVKQASFAIVPRTRNGRRCYRLTVSKGNRVRHDAPWSNQVVDEFIARLRLTREAA